VEQDWLEETLRPYKDTAGDKEDKELAKKAADAPLPTNVSAFKGHPLYALQRHLLKFEAIYPPTAPTLGFIRGEGVYAWECVHTLQGRTSWLKEGRVVRLGEETYKVVKARPKWDRMTGSKQTEEPLDLFGLWQTELYIPPPAKDGKVPRNEYGNVELFKPWMLPVGCVQIPINGMSRVIRQTGIDAAPAMVGWDFSGELGGGGCFGCYK
jgi:xeroderma pigmentosum group C-complementing protein